jgi:hypothetical protein
MAILQHLSDVVSLLRYAHIDAVWMAAPPLSGAWQGEGVKGSRFWMTPLTPLCDLLRRHSPGRLSL